MKTLFRFLLPVVALVAVVACAHKMSTGPMASATLQSTSGSTAQGTAHFTELAAGGVEVKLDVTGVAPGVHGFHIHDKGDCGDNGNAAGPHFNPTNQPHGAPDSDAHHSGDFGNVMANDKGEIHHHFVTHSVTVSAGSNSVVGHAVILHGNPDDLKTQPSGNAGPRIACGVVTMMSGM